MTMSEHSSGSNGRLSAEHIRQVITYEYPVETLRLSTQRRPFAHVPPELVATIAERAIAQPSRRGRYSDAVRDALGFSRVRLSGPVTVEAHIDLTFVDHDLNLSLFRLGFEPDDFAKMQPAKYRHHFTLEFSGEPSGGVARDFHRLVQQAAKEAASLIEAHPVAHGYVETEIYLDKYNVTFPLATFNTQKRVNFPFDETSFEILHVPETEDQRRTSCLDLYTKRAADLHVKILGGFPSWREGGLETMGDHVHPCEKLRSALEAAGFYEIISQAGNYIYSAHFFSLREANSVYRMLSEYARHVGGVRGIAREICTGIWRTTYNDGRSLRLSEVPPILRFTNEWSYPPNSTHNALMPIGFIRDGDG
jgi:hypothetical protein